MCILWLWLVCPFLILQITENSRWMQWVLVCDSIATGRGGTPSPLYHRKAVTWVQWVKQAPESHWIRKKEPNRTELHIKSTSSTGEAATACTWKRNLAFCRLSDFVLIKCKLGSKNIGWLCKGSPTQIYSSSFAKRALWGTYFVLGNFS